EPVSSASTFAEGAFAGTDAELVHAAKTAAATKGRDRFMTDSWAPSTPGMGLQSRNQRTEGQGKCPAPGICRSNPPRRRYAIDERPRRPPPRARRAESAPGALRGSFATRRSVTAADRHAGFAGGLVVYGAGTRNRSGN